MATFGYRKIPDELAGDLPDLFSVQQDLEAAKRYGSRLRREREDPRSADWDVIAGLTEAAIIRYARCFTTGHRLQLDETWLDSAHVKAHRKFLDIRRQHVAHSVNDYEESHARIYVVEPPDPPSVNTVGLGGDRVAALSVSDIDALADLCEYLLLKVRERIEATSREVQVRIMKLPVPDVYAWPKPEGAAAKGHVRPQGNRTPN